MILMLLRSHSKCYVLYMVCIINRMPFLDAFVIMGCTGVQSVHIYNIYKIYNGIMLYNGCLLLMSSFLPVCMFLVLAYGPTNLNIIN